MKTLLEEVKGFDPYNEQEEADKKLLMTYLTMFDDIFYRENLMAHMTSSPWIVNQDMSKVLMIYHNIYDSWGWCGGHCDGDEDTLHVALKEGMEETGLTKLTPLSEHIMAIDILPVPPHKKRGKFVSSHVHLNVTYACVADETENLHIKADENSGVRWIPVEEIDTWVREEDMKPVYHKLVEKTKVMAEQKRKVSLQD